MMATENEEIGRTITQGHSAVETYDSKHGRYVQREPAVKPVKENDQIKAPFRAGGK
jgi:hypothetical protein